MLRRARKHSTRVVREAVQYEPFEDWTVGQRVVTQDGLLGTVVAVQHGPFLQTQKYEVVYDGGMGQGQHTAVELTAAVTPMVASRSEANRESEAGLGRTVAAEDYPELAGVVEEWPSAEVPIEGRRQDYEVPVQITRKGKRTASHQRAAGDIWDYVPGARWLGEALQERAEQRGYDYETRPSIDWCRYRADSQCWYPRHLDAQATEATGVPIFLPESRGYCERVKWDDQAQCPMAWPETRTGRTDALPQFWDPQRPNPNPLSRAAATTGQKNYGESLQRQSVITADAAWADVRSKAKRLRGQGAVSITSVTDNQVAAEVNGDSGTYTTILTYEPGSKRVAMWECDCDWAKYSWGRSGRWKKLEGRQCSHALAVVYEMQSRGFGGAVPQADAFEGLSPDDIVRGARRVDFPAQVRGRSVQVTDVTDGMATLADGDILPGDELEHIKYDPSLGLRVSVLKDEPEPALPSTTGADDEDDEALLEGYSAAVEIGPPSNEQMLQDPQDTQLLKDVDLTLSDDGVPKASSLESLRPAWLDPNGSGPAQQNSDRLEIAAAAKAFLKEGLKTFTPTEQQELISEAAVEGLARNLDRLDLSGTHYEGDLGSDLFL